MRSGIHICQKFRRTDMIFCQSYLFGWKYENTIFLFDPVKIHLKVQKFKIWRFIVFKISQKWFILEQTLNSMTHIILVIFWRDTEMTFSCGMHHFGDVTTLVFKPNKGWLSKMPIQKALISLKMKSYYKRLMPGAILILLIYYTYEVKHWLY